MSCTLLVSVSSAPQNTFKPQRKSWQRSFFNWASRASFLKQIRLYVALFYSPFSLPQELFKNYILMVEREKVTDLWHSQGRLFFFQFRQRKFCERREVLALCPCLSVPVDGTCAADAGSRSKPGLIQTPPRASQITYTFSKDVGKNGLIQISHFSWFP